MEGGTAEAEAALLVRLPPLPVSSTHIITPVLCTRQNHSSRVLLQSRVGLCTTSVEFLHFCSLPSDVLRRNSGFPHLITLKSHIHGFAPANVLCDVGETQFAFRPKVCLTNYRSRHDKNPTARLSGHWSLVGRTVASMRSDISISVYVHNREPYSPPCPGTRSVVHREAFLSEHNVPHVVLNRLIPPSYHTVILSHWNTWDLRLGFCLVSGRLWGLWLVALQRSARRN